jgi:hypothetical protein
MCDRGAVDITNATGPAGDRPEASARPLSAAAVPLWRKAPVLLLRYPEILAATAITAFLLAIATTAGTLFLAAAGTAAIGAHSEDLVSPVSAVRVAQYGAVPGLSLEESTARRSGALSEAFAGVAGLGDPIVTTLGVAPRLSAPSGTGRSWLVQLVRGRAAGGWCSS